MPRPPSSSANQKPSLCVRVRGCACPPSSGPSAQPLGGGASRGRGLSGDGGSHWPPAQTALVVFPFRSAVRGAGTMGCSGGLGGALETQIRGRPRRTIRSLSERPSPTGSSRPPVRDPRQQRGAGSPVPQAPLLLRKEPDPLPRGGGSWIRRTEAGLPQRPLGRRGGCRASGKWAGSAEEEARPRGKSARCRGALALCRPRVAAAATATAGVAAF